MGKMRKYVSLFLAAMLCMAPATAIPSATVTLAAEPQPTADAQARDAVMQDGRYFYWQLTDEAKLIYDAMVEMYQNGVFQKLGEYDLTEGGYVTQALLKDFATGGKELLNVYGAARDAFQYDFPDVFWVDYSALSVRVTQDGDGTFHGYLGSGRTDTYGLPGLQTEDAISSAIRQYDEKMDEIVAEVESAGDTVEQIGAAHDYITKHMLYRYEDEVSAGNARTSYDAVIYGEGVCEAYTRAFKAILDRMEIPCVCVYGVYRPNDRITEQHIWNYVQVNGKWYGIDVTHDDPTNKAWVDKESGHETRQYWMVGQTGLAGHHIPSGIMSPANFEFSYPDLELEGYSESYVVENDDLKVKVVRGINDEDDEFITEGTYCISYQGKNYTENEQDGKYMVIKYFTYAPGTDTWTVTDWSYIDPWIYNLADSDDIRKQWEPDEGMEDLGGHYINLAMPQVKKVQVAITDIAPSYIALKKEFKENNGFKGDQAAYNEWNNRLFAVLKDGGSYYKGDPSLFTIVSDEIENEWGDYVAPPYPTNQVPSTGATLEIGQTYDMSLSFTEQMKRNEEDLDVVVNSTESLNADKNASTGAIYSKISDVEFDEGHNRLTFKFTPSQQYADNSCHYALSIKGLIGTESLKAPIPLSYIAAYPCSAYAFQAQGYDWNVFGQPQLLETSDVATTGWQAQDMETGETETVDISDKISHRLTLVTSEPSEVQSNEMRDLLSSDEEYGKENVLASNTYNIKLTLCKKQIISTGQGVRVSVGFPAGFNYDSTMEGVTFKAYHYIVDPETNQIVDVEEIPVTVTPYGLIITVDSFSPFTIAAVEADEDDVPSKTVILGSGLNGAFYGQGGKRLEAVDSILTLDDAGDNTSIEIRPDEGYELDEVTVNGQPQHIADPSSMNVSLDFDQLGATTVIDAQFATILTHESEQQRGEVHEFNAIPAEITVQHETVNIDENGTIHLAPEINAYSGEHTYQWYKDGVEVEDGNSPELRIENATAKDSGVYYLKVTTVVGEETVSAESSKITVTVGTKHVHTPGVPVRENVHPASCESDGHYDEVTYCADCHEKMYSVQKTITATGHQFDKWETVESPSCSNHGSQKRVCNICGYTETKNVDPSGHEWEEEYTIDVEATCSHDGSKSIHCKKCDEVTSSETIPEKEHTPAAAKEENRKDPTCDLDGSYEMVVYCSECNKELSRAAHLIAATDHAFPQWKATQAATCTEDGKETRTCTTCGYTETKALHATGHVWDEDFTVTKEASCEDYGERAILCSVCGVKGETVKIPPTGHNAVRTGQKDASCTTDEYDGDVTCTKCGEVLVKGKTIPAYGHDFKNGICSRCGERQTASGSGITGRNADGSGNNAGGSNAQAQNQASGNTTAATASSTENGAAATATDAPKTGDPNRTLPYLLMAAGGVAVLIAVPLSLRKKRMQK